MQVTHIRALERAQKMSLVPQQQDLVLGLRLIAQPAFIAVGEVGFGVVPVVIVRIEVIDEEEERIRAVGLQELQCDVCHALRGDGAGLGGSNQGLIELPEALVHAVIGGDIGVGGHPERAVSGLPQDLRERELVGPERPRQVLHAMLLGIEAGEDGGDSRPGPGRLGDRVGEDRAPRREQGSQARGQIASMLCAGEEADLVCPEGVHPDDDDIAPGAAHRGSRAHRHDPSHHPEPHRESDESVADHAQLGQAGGHRGEASAEEGAEQPERLVGQRTGKESDGSHHRLVTPALRARPGPQGDHETGCTRQAQPGQSGRGCSAIALRRLRE